MTKILVLQGAGMNMRGKSQIEIFGTKTLHEINEEIMGYGKALDVTVNIFHSNIEGALVDTLYDAYENGYDGALVNPAGNTASAPALKNAIPQVGFPVIEIHFSNPSSRGLVSYIHPACKGLIWGFGVYGYFLGMEALKHNKI
tara:strand:+ start:197 stop:625 length:429 start_codon:yes stop_codon:yes gene_type:complete